MHVRIGGRELRWPSARSTRSAIKALAQRILREPFTKRPWVELAFFLVSGGLAVLGLAFVGLTMVAGVVLAITFFGLALLALSLRSARGIGGWNRGLARVHARRGGRGPRALRRPPWLPRAGCSRPCATGWAGGPSAYLAIKVPWTLLGFFVPSACGGTPSPASPSRSSPRRRRARGLRADPRHLPRRRFCPGRAASSTVSVSSSAPSSSSPRRGPCAASSTSTACSSAACSDPTPWPTRVRSLEQARTQTVDASAATLRRIERDLHDGTQAQLVALAMRLGMAKEKLDDADHVDLDRVRELVDEAHRGAKEAIAELRDIARGIHPPALDIGLEGALTTLAARSAVPTEISFDLRSRPTPAIEAIAYFCVAELLANVAQHAQASRASVSCAQQGTWLRLVVRDDGRGGAGSPGRLLVERSGRPHRPGARSRRAAEPRQPPRRAHRRHRRPPAVRLMVGALRIAIAEDSAILRDGLVQLLVDRGFAITGAVGDPDALRSSVAQNPPDVAVIDIRMPPTFTDEGLRLALDLRDRHEGLGILLFSQYIETRYAADLLADDAAGIGYLLKDRVADVSDFVEALERVAIGGTALDPEVVTQLLGATRRTRLALGAHTPRARGPRRSWPRAGQRGHRPRAGRQRGRRGEARRQHFRQARSARLGERPSPCAGGSALLGVVIVPTTSDGCAVGVVGQAARLRQLPAGLHLEGADPSGLPGPDRPRGDRLLGLRHEAEAGADVLAGAVGHGEPVHAEEVDAGGPRLAVAAERAAPHGVGQADRHGGLAERWPGEDSNRPAPVAR